MEWAVSRLVHTKPEGCSNLKRRRHFPSSIVSKNLKLQSSFVRYLFPTTWKCISMRQCRKKDIKQQQTIKNCVTKRWHVLCLFFRGWNHKLIRLSSRIIINGGKKFTTQEKHVNHQRKQKSSKFLFDSDEKVFFLMLRNIVKSSTF